MNRRAVAVTAAGTLALSLSGAGIATAGTAPALRARDDAYRVRAGRTLTVHGHGVLQNDRGRPVTLVSHTSPAHGSLSLNPDGSFRYTPAAGFTGTDTFRYTVSDAVRLYATHLPPLATIGGVKVTGGAYGSALAPVPGHRDEFYGLTDRGPNVDGPNGTKILPLPGFTPAIGRFRLKDGTAVLERTIPLRAADGTPYNGRVNPQATTGETLTDLDGNTLAPSANGYDSEGLVAMRDGSFWVSDEYGPFITHFDRDGRAIERLSPFDGSLPRELANRVPNKGMEGLTLTPDGRTLVGIMQSALQQPDLTAKTKNVTTLRIVTYDLRTRATHEYVYLLDDPKTNSGAVSEITALSGTRFLVDERDGNPEPGAYKRLFTIDLSGATDVGPRASVPGAGYDAAKGGLLVGADHRTIDAYVGADDTATAQAALASAGVTPVRKSLGLDLGGLLTRLDPAGGFFGHDKIEGVATTDGGRTLVISNDSDFGIDGITNDAPPFALHTKTLPDGRQDDGEYLEIDTTRLPAAVATATVTVKVTG
ncbi:esterase-like activity of phytase family protein [Actinoallomurus soli]|uniref:esterase-like activity of phytase family protein n=1 Tax=Actinoallomurus soli TaxID=2952535 RepID=UPI0020920A89|nr:esterase-like activity of phytase family protein [Actinoallomurus soli]MCO5971132.1 esterase-like activity of phytase family protein [Actinoallomurus soli]